VLREIGFRDPQFPLQFGRTPISFAEHIEHSQPRGIRKSFAGPRLPLKHCGLNRSRILFRLPGQEDSSSIDIALNDDRARTLAVPFASFTERTSVSLHWIVTDENAYAMAHGFGQSWRPLREYGCEHTLEGSPVSPPSARVTA
jgi:hypothetical protein